MGSATPPSACNIHFQKFSSHYFDPFQWLKHGFTKLGCNILKDDKIRPIDCIAAIQIRLIPNYLQYETYRSTSPIVDKSEYIHICI